MANPFDPLGLLPEPVDRPPASPAAPKWDAAAVRRDFIERLAAKLGPAHSADDATLRQQLADNAALGPLADIGDSLEAAGMGALQGASLHFSDEVLAALRSLVGSESYDEALASHRGYLHDVQQRNPLSYGAGDIAGTMAAPGVHLASLPLRYGLKAGVSAFGGGEGGIGERLAAAAPRAALSSILGPLSDRMVSPVIAKAAYKLGDPWLAKH